LQFNAQLQHVGPFHRDKEAKEIVNGIPINIEVKLLSAFEV
jgi:hypothetical protein